MHRIPADMFQVASVNELVCLCCDSGWGCTTCEPARRWHRCTPTTWVSPRCRQTTGRSLAAEARDWCAFGRWGWQRNCGRCTTGGTFYSSEREGDIKKKVDMFAFKVIKMCQLGNTRYMSHERLKCACKEYQWCYLNIFYTEVVWSVFAAGILLGMYASTPAHSSQPTSPMTSRHEGPASQTMISLLTAGYWSSAPHSFITQSLTDYVPQVPPGSILKGAICMKS